MQLIPHPMQELLVPNQENKLNLLLMIIFFEFQFNY